MKHYTRSHNHNEINAIIALNSNELKSFANGDSEEVLTIKEMVAEEIRMAEEEAKAMAEYQRLLEEEEKENAALEECLTRIENRINDLLSKGDKLTIEDVAKISQNLDFYSDVFKDVNGIRPHWYLHNVWCAMKEIAPATIEIVEEMDKNGEWSDFVFNVK